MDKCKTCAYWRVPKVGVFEGYCNPIDYDTDKPILPFLCGYCMCPLLIECGSPTCSNGAAVVDASDYKAKLICAPYFGCVNHKPTKEHSDG